MMRLGRLPILAKLTAAFAAATLLMLVAAALFVTLRLRADIDDRVNANLHARSVAAAQALAEGTDIADVAVEDPEESFAQVLVGDRVVETDGSVAVRSITPAEVGLAAQEPLMVERQLAGIDGKARLLATAASSPSGPAVVVVGQSLVDRNEALASVVTSFLVGGAVALIVASALGYALARSGLAPVEAMRSRASRISADSADTQLPLPAANDQLRRLGETLNDMLSRLHEAYERERRFVEDASHELRTPLAVIKTDLEGVLMARDHSPRATEAIQSALDETDRLARTADDLLVLARADNRQLALRPTGVAADDLFDWTIARFGRRAKAMLRQVVCVPCDGIEVRADRDRLRQVLFNLVDNALSHGEGLVTLSATLSDGGVAITVTDQGEGFRARFAAHALERFARADTVRRTDGAGLGLAIVETIAKAHGGRAWVDVGRPSAVHVWLPDPDSAAHRLLTSHS
jgi:two-component system OmpR family sensor kinase